MVPRISNTTRKVSINIYASLINANNRPVTNIGASLIDSRNNGNNCERDRKDCTLAVKYQETIRRSVSLFLVNSIYKHIRSTNF